MAADRKEVLYRYFDQDFGLAFWGHKPELPRPREFRVVKRTKQGAWISQGFWGEPKFVRLTARKKWACETKEAALESFIARKNRQIRILKAQLERAQDNLAAAKGAEKENGE